MAKRTPGSPGERRDQARQTDRRVKYRLYWLTRAHSLQFQCPCWLGQLSRKKAGQQSEGRTHRGGLWRRGLGMAGKRQSALWTRGGVSMD